MANARRCDICGAFYDSYNVQNNEEKPNGFMLVNIDDRQKYFHHYPYDCCPLCMNSIMKHIESLKKEYEKC